MSRRSSAPIRADAMRGSTSTNMRSTRPPRCKATASRSGRAEARGRFATMMPLRGSSTACSRRSNTPPSRHVTIGFEPEPGMLIDTMARWEELLAQPGMEDLCLTLDVGHLHCQGEGPIDAVIQRWAHAAGQRTHRGHARGRPRAPDVRRGRDRFSADPPRAGRASATSAASTWNSAATATKARSRHRRRLIFCKAC